MDLIHWERSIGKGRGGVGVRLFESHRMEILAEAFVATLASAAEEGDLDPLRPRTVIPQNPVTGRWLSFYLARRTGISASLDLPLAGRYILWLSKRRMPTPPLPFPTDLSHWMGSIIPETGKGRNRSF